MIKVLFILIFAIMLFGKPSSPPFYHLPFNCHLFHTSYLRAELAAIGGVGSRSSNVVALLGRRVSAGRMQSLQSKAG